MYLHYPFCFNEFKEEIKAKMNAYVTGDFVPFGFFWSYLLYFSRFFQKHFTELFRTWKHSDGDIIYCVTSRRNTPNLSHIFSNIYLAP